MNFEVTHKIEIDIDFYGKITLELYGKEAPETVENFVTLAKGGFYNGLTFHRIIKGFMMQGGDPEGNGTGGSGRNIKGEFRLNGVNNRISHKKGVISMARAQSYNSASSQFFIMHENGEFLDGQYAAFGAVTDGIDTVNRICSTVPSAYGSGAVSPSNQPKINEIRVVDEK